EARPRVEEELDKPEDEQTSGGAGEAPSLSLHGAVLAG
ncbi:MAG: hypothetical protein ACJAV2_000994, partial [Myxococcota bacterium]